ncbi:MAG TPA: hypothetical protein VLG46_10805 [Anaerolineae bacterium]|nr:hypothetical protein [Anaerolineae bacterium]
MKIQYLVSLLAVFIIALTACAGPTPSATADWQTYTNPQAGFSIRYPPTWKSEVLPDQNNGALHGVALKGTEGGVELYWGVGIGGGCTPEASQMIKVAQGELPTCYAKNADETEHWENISKNLPTTSFSARAYTADAASSSRELVLQVVSTLSFP